MWSDKDCVKVELTKAFKETIKYFIKLKRFIVKDKENTK